MHGSVRALIDFGASHGKLNLKKVVVDCQEFLVAVEKKQHFLDLKNAPSNTKVILNSLGMLDETHFEGLENYECEYLAQSMLFLEQKIHQWNQHWINRLLGKKIHRKEHFKVLEKFLLKKLTIAFLDNSEFFIQIKNKLKENHSVRFFLIGMKVHLSINKHAEFKAHIEVPHILIPHSFQKMFRNAFFPQQASIFEVMKKTFQEKGLESLQMHIKGPTTLFGFRDDLGLIWKIFYKREPNTFLVCATLCNEIGHVLDPKEVIIFNESEVAELKEFIKDLKITSHHEQFQPVFKA